MDRRARIARLALLAALALVAGCAGPSPIASRRSLVGSLKSRVSQLESENEGLRTEVAEKRRDARVAQDRLVQAESDNGELMARLDDARNLIRDQGGDVSALARPEPSRRARTAPAGRDGSKSRKSPLTQIPG